MKKEIKVDRSWAGHKWTDVYEHRCVDKEEVTECVKDYNKEGSLYLMAWVECGLTFLTDVNFCPFCGEKGKK